MRRKSVLRKIVPISSLLVIALSASQRSLASEQSSDVPAWLTAHIGEGAGQIAQPVLQRARALYLQKSSEGKVKNPCYFAMDATRPNDPSKSDGRFYVICEASRSFEAISAGHGSGHNLPGVADFANGGPCAKNFGNALDSNLTTGGAYVTAEAKTAFMGYYRVSANQDVPFLRTFVQFDGEGSTANARQRAIGGHEAVVLKGVCLRKEPSSPYANGDGYVRFGHLLNYTGGLSNGCTSWSPSDVQHILSMVQSDPTTLYIYPEAADIDAVARAVAAGGSVAHAGLYWNAACLKKIRSPKFWSAESLGPMIAQYEREHTAPPRPMPICTGQ